MSSAASARGITYRCTGLAGRTLTSDRDLLRHVLANLCDNAISHGDAGTEVVITATVADVGGMTVTIANQASTAPADLSAAGHRLWRADRARTDAGRHIGIGLSLCHRLLRVISGSLLVERQGTQVVVALRIPDLNGSGVVPGALPTPT